MMEGEKIESHQKGFLKLKYFSPLKILTLFYLKRLLKLFFLLLAFLYAPSLEDSRVLMIFEEKIIFSKTSFQMA
jgi:hypothetical protein